MQQREKNIPLRSPEEEGMSKEPSICNVDDLLSLPQETESILIDALVNLGASRSSASIFVTHESAPYCMSICFLDEDLILESAWAFLLGKRKWAEEFKETFGNRD